MTRLLKILTVAAVVAGFGFATQSASAGGPVKYKQSVVVFPTYPTPRPIVRPYPIYPVYPVSPIYPVFGPLPRIDYDYAVLYRPSFFASSQVFGRFETLFQAQNAARSLEYKGFPTRIERYRDTGIYGW